MANTEKLSPGLTVTVAAPEYDTLWRRAGAFLLDFWLAGLIVGCVTFPLRLITESARASALGSLVATLLIPVYFVLLEHKFGGTLGKRLAGLVVRGRAGSRPDLAALLKRYAWLFVVAFVSSAASVSELPIGAGLLIILIVVWTVAELHHAWRSPERRTLHDVMAGTTVVFRGYKDAKSKPMSATDQ